MSKHESLTMRAAAAALILSTGFCTTGTAQAQTADPFVFYAHDDTTLNTYAFGIDSAKDIVGYYYDANYKGTAFIRAADGTYTDLPYPTDPTVSTFGKAINDNGQVIGSAIVGGWNQGWGYDMATKKYTFIKVPGATATFPEAITQSGVVAGFTTFYDSTGTKWWYDGFVLKNGKYTTITVPGATNTYLRSINDKGELAGYYEDSTGSHTFTMDPDGTVHTVVPVNAAGWQMAFYGINNKDQATGLCLDANWGNEGCLYDPASGAVSMFLVPGLISTTPWALTNKGLIVGYGANSNYVSAGFVMSKTLVGTN